MGFDQGCIVSLLFSITFLSSVAEENVQYSYRVSMVSSCSGEIKYVKENSFAYVSWRGEDPGADGCKVTFEGKPRNQADVRYQVRVKPEHFSVYSNGIYLRYYDGDNTVPSRVYTKGDEPVIFYGSVKNQVHIEVTVNRNGRVDLSGSSFSLEVSAVELSSDSAATNLVVGVVLGTMAVIGTIVTIIIVIRYKQLKKIHGPARLRWDAPSFLQPQDGTTIGAPNQVILSSPDPNSRYEVPSRDIYTADNTSTRRVISDVDDGTLDLRMILDSDVEPDTRRFTDSPPAYDELPPSYNTVIRKETTL